MTTSPGFARKPDYPLTIQPAGRAVSVRLNGQVIASSENALEMREADYPPVLYFPPEDVDMAAAARTETTSFCPFKGEASYWRFDDAADVAWSYEAPFDEVAGIAGHLAFYPDRVDAID
ncbi:MAG: DUF427 domain-containing protein [Magnetovibrio sp.]|nr:DUF427 domain-containing protein [Magnetovibrio sp.]